MLHPTWSSYPTWLITRQLIDSFLSDLDYNFNLTPTWLLIFIISDLFTLQFGFLLLQNQNYNDILQLGISNQPVDNSTLG
jgi:hypothetical protein